MRKSRVLIAIGALLPLAGVAIAAVYVPRSCYTAPEGTVRLLDWARHLVQLHFQECDPFEGLRSARPIGRLTIEFAFEGYQPDQIELTVDPDGMARVSRGYDGRHSEVILTPAGYAFFRDRLAPFRDYYGTEVPGEPDSNGIKDPSRRRIFCESVAPAGSGSDKSVFITWGSTSQVRRPRHGTPSDASMFDLSCDGPAGPALRTRMKPVVDRLFKIDSERRHAVVE